MFKPMVGLIVVCENELNEIHKMERASANNFFIKRSFNNV